MNADTIVSPLVVPIELTTAIVTAAKRVRKSKVAVEPDLPSIVDEIAANFLAGNFTQEAIANLSRVFNREFVVEQEPEPPVPDVPAVPEPKAKKPRAKKVIPTSFPESIVGGAVVEEPKAEVKKTKAPKKKAEPVVPPSSEEEEVKPVAAKKPRKVTKKPTLPEEVAKAVPEVAEAAVKKPRKVVAKKNEPEEEEEKKETKTKEIKPKSKKEDVALRQKKLPTTPVLVEDEEDLPDLGSRLTEELEEEELSDIEE